MIYTQTKTEYTRKIHIPAHSFSMFNGVYNWKLQKSTQALTVLGKINGSDTLKHIFFFEMKDMDCLVL